ncbi:MAG: glycosyltransferase family 39 protein [Acidimicrobiia bacterium]
MRHPRAAAVAGTLSVVAFGLGVLPGARGGLWQDEGVSATAAAGSWHDLWHMLRTYDPNMSLYDVVLRVWQVGGTGEAWMRSLSALFLGATVFVVYLVATRLRDPYAGMAAAFVFAFAPLAVRYSHETRSYGLLAFLVAVATLCFVRFVDDPSAGRAIACGAVTALAAYAHAYGLLVAVAFAVSLLLLGRSLPRARLLAVLGGAYAVCVAPFLLLVAAGPDPLIDWIQRPSFGTLRGTAAQVAGNNVLLLLTAIAIGILVFQAWRVGQTDGRSGALWSLGLPVLGVLVPPVVALVWSLAVQPILVGRYLIVSLPALAVTAGVALTFVHRTALQIGVLVVVLGASAVTIRNVVDEPKPHDFSQAVAYFVAHAQPGDGVVFCPSSVRPAFEWYLLRDGAAHDLVPISPSVAWSDGTHADEGNRAELARFADAPRIWVVALDESVPAANAPCALDRSMAGRTATPTRDVGHVRLTRYDS